MAVDESLGVIKLGPLWLRVYRIEMREGKFILHSVARDAKAMLDEVEPDENGQLHCEVVAADGSLVLRSDQPGSIFDEARLIGYDLKDVWMTLPLCVEAVSG